MSFDNDDKWLLQMCHIELKLLNFFKEVMNGQKFLNRIAWAVQFALIF